MGRSVRAIKKITDHLVVVLKETGPEVSADKAKYIVMFWVQSARWSERLKTDKSCEMAEKFKYLRTTLMNQNYIHEEIKSRFQ